VGRWDSTSCLGEMILRNHEMAEYVGEAFCNLYLSTLFEICFDGPAKSCQYLCWRSSIEGDLFFMDYHDENGAVMRHKRRFLGDDAVS